MKQALHSASGIRFLITEVRTNIQRAFNAINWRHVLGPFLIVALMWPLAAVTPMQAPTAARVQPVLLQMAAAQPDQVVGVIIQKTAQATGVENLRHAWVAQIPASHNPITPVRSTLTGAR
jgi:hypothetical protein